MSLITTEGNAMATTNRKGKLVVAYTWTPVLVSMTALGASAYGQASVPAVPTPVPAAAVTRSELEQTIDKLNGAILKGDLQTTQQIGMRLWQVFRARGPSAEPGKMMIVFQIPTTLAALCAADAEFKEKLRQHQNLLLQEFAATGRTQPLTDFISLNEIIGDLDVTVEWVRRERDNQEMWNVLNQLVATFEHTLVHQGEWELLGSIYQDPQQMLRDAMWDVGRMPEKASSGATLAARLSAVSRASERAGVIYAALLRAG
jgi:hypothetical protein